MPEPIAVRAKISTRWGMDLASAKLAPAAILGSDRWRSRRLLRRRGQDQLPRAGRQPADEVSIMWLVTSHCAARGLPLGRALIGKPVMMKALASIQLSSSEV
jgi:hypothetical protein